MTVPAVAYVDVATVMASTANGTVVPSAYGDQVRDNLVAVYNGWWFRATGAVSQTPTNGAWKLVTVTTFDTAYDAGVTASVDGMASISAGYLLLTRLGVWQISGALVGSTTNLQAGAVGFHTTTTQVNAATDYKPSGDTALNFGTVVKVATSPSYVSLWVYANSTVGLSSTVAPVLSGVWLGDA